MNFFYKKEHIFDKIAKMGIPQVDFTLELLEIGFGGKKQMRSNAAAEPIFVLFYAALNAFVKAGLHCSGHRQSGLVAFKYAVELWISTVMYQNQKSQVMDVIQVHETQKWHDVAPECFVDHLYEVFVSDHVLARLATTSKHETAVKAALTKVTSNLYSEYNAPLTIVAAAAIAKASPKKPASPKAPKAPKEPKA